MQICGGFETKFKKYGWFHLVLAIYFNNVLFWFILLGKT